MKIYFKTFGCRTNIYDTELIKTYIKDFSIIDDEVLADVIIVNSCTVTNGADSDVRNYINKMNKKGKKVFLTGCGAISKGRELFDKDSVFGVFGMSQKEKIQNYIKSNSKFYDIGNLKSVEKNIVTSYIHHTKAFVKIQEGCNFACSYCIIPSVRGRSRSMDEKIILDEARKLINNGFNELVLTGTNMGSYGRDINSSFGELLQKLGSINGLKRIRLGSLEPSQIDEQFKEILDEDWIERHLHIAIQHSSEVMLKIMKRRNNVKSDIELFNSISEKGYALGTDFIVAHPGESEEIWNEAIENFKKLPITHIHAFIYSPRSGTPSSLMHNNINGEVAKHRLKMLQNIVSLKNIEFRKNNYNSLKVLVERKIKDLYEGYDQYYNKVFIDSNSDLSKKWVEVNKYDIRFEANYAKV